MLNQPEPVTASLPTAGLIRRLAALLYDAFLVLAIWITLGFAAQLIAGAGTNQVIDGRVETDPLFGLLLFALMCASAAAFYVWFWTRGGQTLGMVAWRIRAQSRDGNLMTVRQALLRFLCAWPAFFLFGLGYLWLYFDPEGDAAHDRLSRTRVVLLPRRQR
ncbi:MAG: RDD family protein [Gammaproteobacteria bacterium]|nr:RDD family protein [Gammaproteobacteria bacterium]MYH46428.1 RDD family protein [Gammaproteobacteria bacterium]MYL13360.1 RDD family protein [Gammaproteobacteria bacterium]